MRIRVPWIVLGSAIALAACGLSTEGVESSGIGGPDSSTTHGDDANGSDLDVGPAPVADAATDSRRASDAPLHEPDARTDARSDTDAPTDASEGGERESGETGEDAPVDAPATGPDAGDTGTSAVACDGGPGCVVVPPGWTLVAFASSQSAACPAGYATPDDLIEGPDASNACSCSACTVTGPPSCASGSVAVYYDTVTAPGSGQCGTPGVSPMLDNSPAGQCGSGSDVYHGDYSLYDIEYIPPPASGGSCSAPGSATGAVTYAAQDRTCVPQTPQAAGCVGDACMPDLAAPYSACIMQSGVAACPPGPLGVQHLAGSGVSFGCSACGCSVSATCTGTVTLYTDTKCTKTGVTIPADGSCNRITTLAGPGTHVYEAYTYAGNAPTSPSCTASGTSSAENLALAQQVTLCCAQ